jgi:hypothetical protein
MLIVAAILFCTCTSFGQDVNGFFEFLKSNIKEDGQLAVNGLKQFTQKESEAFRPVYNEFEYELDTLSDKSSTNIEEKKWGFLVEPYIMFPVISGQIGIGNLPPVELDVNTGDILANLHMAAMLYLEARNNEWAITSDIVYMNLQQDITPDKIISSGTATIKQTIWEAAGLYRILPFLEVGLGARLNVISTELNAERNVFPRGTEEITGEHSKTFIDPLLITRLTTDIEGKWLFQFRGDLGGFSIGSDFTWQLQGYAGYRFSKLFQLSAGYRILGIDYDDGENKERFIFDVNEYGPVIRLGFNF